MPRGLPEDQVTPIRELLRAHLDSGRLTQDEVAKAMGVSQATVSDIKNGRRGIGVKSLPALARLLGQTADQLLGGRPAPPPSREFVLDVRYPNRSSAVEAWRLLRRDERAAERVLSMGMDSDADPEPGLWFAHLELAEASIKAEDKDKATSRPDLDDDYGAPKLPARKPR